MRNVVRIAVFLLVVLLQIPAPSAINAPADVEPLTNQYYLPKVIELIEGAKTSINVIMYSMVWYDKYPDSPSNKLIKLLCDASKRKINVTVILNRDKKNDSETQKNKTAAEKFQKAGVKVIYDSLEQTTHAKILIIDRRFVVIGSFNWSYYSLEKNNETAVVVDSTEIAEYFLKYFNSIAVRGFSVQHPE
ncbi:MAG: phospholipase D-like domain-containing protein [Candidatus Omnitrophica bacterium]|nr:phospholipase D-like domain-containing protein [Candidatus Omnitrophota bacterium]MCM8829191.1 phospholipase D-like domain-containing protein [Candidatus Omnitrophota bacterium]